MTTQKCNENALKKHLPEFLNRIDDVYLTH
jgi:hypothetical protein